MSAELALALFRKSVLKQAKYRRISALLDDPVGQRCLDIGADNGVISLLLRRRGGRWASADLDQHTVASIRELVGDDVLLLLSGLYPFLWGISRLDALLWLQPGYKLIVRARLAG